MNKKCNRKKRLIFIPVAIACVFLAGLLVMLLWNNILPAVFGWPALTYWQALGIFVLCKLLFGFGGGGPKRGGPFRGAHRRFADLDPARREKIKAYMQKHQCIRKDETNTDLQD